MRLWRSVIYRLERSDECVGFDWWGAGKSRLTDLMSSSSSQLGFSGSMTERSRSKRIWSALPLLLMRE